MVIVSVDIKGALHRKVTIFSIFLWISDFPYQFGYNKIKTGFFEVDILFVTFHDVCYDPLQLEKIWTEMIKLKINIY